MTELQVELKAKLHNLIQEAAAVEMPPKEFFEVVEEFYESGKFAMVVYDDLERLGDL